VPKKPSGLVSRLADTKKCDEPLWELAKFHAKIPRFAKGLQRPGAHALRAAYAIGKMHGIIETEAYYQSKKK
jgi:hypothetical protein